MTNRSCISILYYIYIYIVSSVTPKENNNYYCPYNIRVARRFYRTPFTPNNIKIMTETFPKSNRAYRTTPATVDCRCNLCIRNQDDFFFFFFPHYRSSQVSCRVMRFIIFTAHGSVYVCSTSIGNFLEHE